jgi:HEAT repeat protein
MSKKYVFGEIVQFDEDREHEAKGGLTGKNNPVEAIIGNKIEENINAFLNTNGGTIYFGVEDDGVITGVLITREQRNKLDERLNSIVSSFSPPITGLIDSGVLWERKFEPVYQPTGEEINDMFILEILVQKGNKHIYRTNSTQAYYREYGSTRKMSGEMVDERYRSFYETIKKMDKMPYAFEDKYIYQNVEEVLKVFELQLRQFVMDMFTKELGSSWLEKLSATEGIQVYIRKWQNIAPKVFSENETILDYSTMGDLRQIITSPNYWIYFGKVFNFAQGKENKKTVSEYFDSIVNTRNTLVHVRSHEQPDLLVAWAAVGKLQSKMKVWYGIDDKQLPQSFETKELVNFLASVDVKKYLGKLIDRTKEDLIREQYEPLGIEPSNDSEPIIGIDDDLLSTKIMARPSGFTSNQAVVTTNLDEILNAKSVKVMLEGDAGAGKTTTLKRLAVHLAMRALSNDETSPIPVYIPLLDYDVAKNNLHSLMLAAFTSLGMQITEDNLDELLRDGNLFLLLDALNETALAYREDCVKELRGLIRKNPDNHFILTARVGDDYQLQAAIYELVPWGKDQMESYTRKAMALLKSKRNSDDLIEKLMPDFEKKQAITTPLMLGLIVQTYDETGDFLTERAKLFSNYIKTLFSRDRNRNPEIKLPDTYKQKMFSGLAFNTFEQGLTALEEDLVLDFIGKKLQEWGSARLIPNDIYAADVLASLKQGRWFREVANGKLKFCFDILLEIFVAIALQDAYKKGDNLDEYIKNPRWETPLILLAGLEEKNADRLIRRVLELAGAKFAGKCLISSPEVKCRSMVVEALCKDLASQNIQRRKSAAELFIHIKDSNSIESLIVALGDKSKEVGWFAALALQRAIGYEESDELFSRILESNEYPQESKHIVCRALRRSGTATAINALLHALTDSKPSIRITASYQLGKINDPQVVNLLETAISQNENPLMVAGSLRALRKVHSGNLKILAQKCVEHQLPEVRNEARIALMVLGDEKIISRSIMAIENSRKLERLEIIKQLGAAGIPQAIEPLWRLLLDKDTTTVREAAYALAAIENNSVKEKALIALQDENALLRRAAVRILSHSNSIQTLELLLPLLADNDPGVRDIVAQYLEKLGNRTIIALEQQIDDGLDNYNDLQCINIINVLQSINSRRSIQILSRELKRESRLAIRVRILDALMVTDYEYTRQIMKDMPEILAILLMDPRMDEKSLTRINNAIVSWGDKDIIRRLEELSASVSEKPEYAYIDLVIIKLKKNFSDEESNIDEFSPFEKQLADPDIQNRLIAVQGLTLNGSKRAIDLLAKATKDDPLSAVRIAALKALGLIGTDEILPIISPSLNDKNTDVREIAFESLAKINTDASISLFIKAFPSQNVEIRRNIIQKLANNVDKHNVFNLYFDSLADDDGTIRSASVEILGRINLSALTNDRLLKFKDVLQKTSSVTQKLSILRVLRSIAGTPEFTEVVSDLTQPALLDGDLANTPILLVAISDTILLALKDKDNKVRQAAKGVWKLLIEQQSVFMGERTITLLRQGVIRDRSTFDDFLKLIVIHRVDGVELFVIDLMKTKMHEYGSLCIWALGELGSVNGSVKLIQLYRGLPYHLKKEAIELFCKIDSRETTAFLMQYVYSNKMSPYVIDALEKRDLSDSYSFLHKWLMTDKTQIVAMRLLPSLPLSPKMIKEIASRIRDSKPEIRYAALCALVKIGSQNSLAYIRNALVSTDQQVRLDILNMLQKTSNPAVAPILLFARRSYMQSGMEVEKQAVEVALSQIQSLKTTTKRSTT